MSGNTQSGRRSDAELNAAIRLLYEQGMTLRQIGRELGISHNSVSGKLTRMKLANRGTPIIYNAEPKPWKPPPVEYWMRTLPALPSLIGHVPLAPMAPWLEAA